jgi:hypothetical protein
MNLAARMGGARLRVVLAPLAVARQRRVGVSGLTAGGRG